MQKEKFSAPVMHPMLFELFVEDMLVGEEPMQCWLYDDITVMISPLSDDELRVLETKGEIWDFDSLLKWMVENKRIVMVKHKEGF